MRRLVFNRVKNTSPMDTTAEPCTSKDERYCPLQTHFEQRALSPTRSIAAHLEKHLEMALTRLPPELWLIIFEMAAHVPGVLDTDIVDPFDEPEPTGFPTGDTYFVGLRHQVRSVRASLRVKSAISRVCQQWHTLVVPILYRVIHLGRSRHISPLQSLLHWPTWKLGRSYGVYTRRLDVALPRENFLRDREITIPLVHLIHEFSNLEIFTVFLNNHNGTTRVPPVIPGALHSTCRNSLRQLRWDCNTNRRELDALVEDSPHLRTVLVKGQPVVSSLCHQVTFTALYEDASIQLEDRPFPSLRQVYLHHLHPNSAERVVNLLSTSCPDLRTVYILYHSTSFPSFLSALERCTSIRHIIVIFSSRNRFPPPMTLPSSITHLGFFFRFDEGSRESYRKLQACLTRTTGHVLRAVRLLNGRNVYDWRERHASSLRKCLSELEGHPWRLEDHRGRRLTVPPR